jgi:two-component system, NtrC family, response regulator GlrR
MSQKTGRILVVDSEPEVLDYTADLLRKQGHEVLTASSSTEAESLARSQAFNLIVTDLEISGPSWETLLRQFLDLQPHTPVIVLTSHGTIDEQADLVIKRGAFDVITKPIDHKRLSIRVRQALSYNVKDMASQEKRILVVDDEPDVLKDMEDLLQLQGYQVHTALSGDEAIEKARKEGFDLIITDLEMPGRLSWDALLQSFEDVQPDTPLIVLTAHGMIQRQHDWITRHKAVYDVVSKPYSPKNLLLRIYQALRETVKNLELLGPRPLSETEDLEIIHCDVLTNKLLERSEVIAKTDLPVLLTGESGAGKEVIARYIHQKSARASMPFVAVNCAAIPKELFESEFFGHVRGAFTSAHADRKGLFETADGGTIFLDEVGEIAAENQGKLLRVLQEDEVKRVGEQVSRRIDTRLICATNRDLRADVREGRFRSDLYYRIKVFPVLIPPLRDRQGDILPLAEHFIESESRRLEPSVHKHLSRSAQQKLIAYSWPGNVRELKNAIRQAVLLSAGEWIEPDDLMLEEEWPAAQVQEVAHATAIRGGSAGAELDSRGAVVSLPAQPKPGKGSQPLRDAKRDWMKSYLESLLEEVGGNISRAAEKSGKHRSELYQLVNRYEIDLSRFRGRPGSEPADEG